MAQIYLSLSTLRQFYPRANIAKKIRNDRRSDRALRKACTFCRCDIRTRCRSVGCAINRAGAAMEDDDMAVDMALWTLVAAVVGFLAFGCMVTRRPTAGGQYRGRQD
jgi:hypothetical protein